MKILKLSSSFPRYEGDYFGPWILEYCRELVRQGHEVTLVAPCPGDMDLNYLSEEGLKIVRFNYWKPRKQQKLVYPPGVIPQLKKNKWRYLQIPFLLRSFYTTCNKLCRENKFDIIHSQWVIPSGYIGDKLSKKYGLPHVITSQGAEFFLPVNHPFSFITKKVLKSCDYLFPVSEQMGIRALKYGIEKQKVKPIPNAVNTEVFKPGIESEFRKKYGLAENDFIFLTIRRLVFEKRVEDVIEAFSKLKERFNNIKLVIGGDGPDRKSLEQLVLKLELTEDVIFMGFVDNNTLPPIYAAANSYILSSQQEGLSLSLLESMSSGLITIATKSTGGNELIENGINGYLYDVGDIKTLVYCMGKAIDHQNRADVKIKYNARQTIKSSYSVKSMVEQWIETYASTLNDHRPK